MGRAEQSGQGVNTGRPLPDPGPPLTGVRVLDFTRFVSGPYATMLLADAGAEVIKVEPLGGEETRQLDPMIDTPAGKSSGYFFRFNRSKKSICVDMRATEGRDIIKRLVESADVVVENFRPGVMDRYGLGYRTLSVLKPSLIYCSISGYGHSESPHREDPAFAILAEVSAGVVGRGVRADDPPIRVGVPLGDLYPGVMAVSGVAMALWRRERTGRGSYVDMAMYDALVSLNENAIAMSSITGEEMLPTGEPTYTAPFGMFKALDGYLCIAVLGEKVWQRFCEAIEQPHMAADESLGSGSKRSAAMNGRLGTAIADWLKVRTRDQAVKRLVEYGVPAGAVCTPFDVIASSQTEARSLLWTVPSYSGAEGRVVGSPIRVEPSSYAPVGAVPAPGEHSREILRELGGYADAEIDALIEMGATEAWS